MIRMSLAVLVAFFSVSALAARTVPIPPKSTLECYDGTSLTASGAIGPYDVYGGLCAESMRGSQEIVMLDNRVLSATIGGVMRGAILDFAGVWLTTSVTGAALSAVRELGFTYTGQGALEPGALAMYLPFNYTGGTTTSAYIVIDVGNCGENGVVNAFDLDCRITVDGVPYAGWAALAKAFPNGRIASDFQPKIEAFRSSVYGPAWWVIANVQAR